MNRMSSGSTRLPGSTCSVIVPPRAPAGRRSLCWERPRGTGLPQRENKPEGSALDVATSMGIEPLTEDQYRQLQQLGESGLLKTSQLGGNSRRTCGSLGGALFRDRRYGKVFTYHNGVQSYYAARGFRGLPRVRASHHQGAASR